jgi:hypothetical protein
MGGVRGHTDVEHVARPDGIEPKEGQRSPSSYPASDVAHSPGSPPSYPWSYASSISAFFFLGFMPAKLLQVCSKDRKNAAIAD